MTSNWARATAAFRRSFLTIQPRGFIWTTGGHHYIDDVPVSERVFDLALAGELAAARAAWLEEWNAAGGRTA